MQFSTISIAAAALFASLAIAAPADVKARQAPTVTVTFKGADAAAFYTQDIPIGQGYVATTEALAPSLSISYITWTTGGLDCNFIGVHNVDGSPETAWAHEVDISYGNAQIGPPQPIVQAECHYLSS